MADSQALVSFRFGRTSWDVLGTTWNSRCTGKNLAEITWQQAQLNWWYVSEMTSIQLVPGQMASSWRMPTAWSTWSTCWGCLGCLAVAIAPTARHRTWRSHCTSAQQTPIWAATSRCGKQFRSDCRAESVSLWISRFCFGTKRLLSTMLESQSDVVKSCEISLTLSTRKNYQKQSISSRVEKHRSGTKSSLRQEIGLTRVTRALLFRLVWLHSKSLSLLQTLWFNQSL